MIKSVLLVISTVVFSPVFSQKEAKPFTFKVDGSIRNYSGKKVYIHHKIGDKPVTDSAKVNNDQFTFNLKNTEPAMYWFTLSTDINAQPNYIFFADESPVKAKLIADSLLFSTVEAGQAQRDYM